MGPRLPRRLSVGAAAAAAALLVAGCAPEPGASPEFDRVGKRTTPSASPVATPPPAATVNAFPVKAAAGAVHYVRAHHDYPATDIFAPCDSAVVAPATGRLVEVSAKDTWSSASNDGEDRGGVSWSLAGADGVRYYGSHLSELAPGARPGAAVTAGQLLGKVGHTGSARGVACHLHFGLSPICGPGDWWVRRGVLAPFTYLKAWQQGTPHSPAAAVAAWRAKHGCPSSTAGVPDP